LINTGFLALLGSAFLVEKISWLSFPEKVTKLQKGNIMTTSSLYHTQGVRGYRLQKTERVADTEIYYLHSTTEHQPCPQCHSRDTQLVETGRNRNIRGLCIGLKKL